jgi:hypothetical protein
MENYQILLSRNHVSDHDAFPEYLCLVKNEDGSITLSSCWHECLAEAGYGFGSDEDANWDDDNDGDAGPKIPDRIGGREVGGVENGYYVSKELVERGDDITVSAECINETAAWLSERDWDKETGFGAAWGTIRAALRFPA